MKRALVPLGFAAAAALVMVGGFRCPIHLAFGVPCPTCGITRATRFALHGDIAGAMHMHPLVWLAVPLAALVLGIELRGYVRLGTWGASKRVRGATALGAAMAATAALLFALWIARFFGAFGGPVV